MVVCGDLKLEPGRKTGFHSRKKEIKLTAKSSTFWSFS